ncbi:zinc finger protein 182 [Kryptolebias marmoratus]|uniref:Zinc finger protein 182-like n=1 Tax=Kryptolebias marmoratus TaxID=37003 RepID=A0A3Q3B3W0_KRYMA|nr:zinc finger protein 182 [Kryptolebias marmoratus]
MESSSFQSQLLSVMEVLAQAAVAEINRRVDDSCAVLRVELSQSRRDIELLKTKYEGMEAELRRSRRRARRIVCVAPADETFSPSSKVCNNQSSDWDTEMGAESPNQPQECADLESADEPANIQIKEECAEDVWRNDPGDEQLSAGQEQPCSSNTRPAQTERFLQTYRSAENPESLGSPADGFNAFPEQQLHEAELVVKDEKEEESAESAAPLGSVHATEEAEAPLWSASLYRDSYSGQQTEQSPSVFAPQTGLHLDNMVPKIHPVGKSHSVLLSAAKMKRQARTFGCKKPQTDEGHSILSQINAINSNLITQQSQHQSRDATPHMGEAMAASNPSVSLCWQSRGSFGLARRTRMPWRSGLGEKRFSCSYCDKTFLRFSQLKEHLRSHTGEKPFSCVQCGRSFTKQCNLIRHAVVHSGEKPFECSLCGKCFTQRSSLKSHQKTAH